MPFHTHPCSTDGCKAKVACWARKHHRDPWTCPPHMGLSEPPSTPEAKGGLCPCADGDSMDPDCKRCGGSGFLAEPKEGQ